MSENNTTTVTMTLPETAPRSAEFKRFVRVFFGRKVVIFGLVIILLLVVGAIFAPFLAPYDPYEPHMDSAHLAPCREFLLGTDAIGRDTLSRLIYGCRTSLLVGCSAIGIGAFFGMTLGLIAGYYGGIINLVIMRFIDSLMSIPMILLALGIAAILGSGLRNVVIALGVGLVAVYARLMCGQVLTVKENDYILAAQSIGARNLRVIMAHIFPNCLPPLIVLITLMLGSTILAEAGLSFLGVGIKPPGCAWGSMVNAGYKVIRSDPYLSLFPGLAIMLVVFAFNMVGDGLRDVLDPRLRGIL
jgi:peptide/nickel transport system permease protein